MKKLAVTLCLSALATAVFAQGSINIANSTSTFLRTNAIATGGTAGNTGGGAGTGGNFVYGIFTANSTVTSLTPSLQELLSPAWTFTGVYGTNTTISTGGRLSGGSPNTLAGWPAGTTNSFVVVGWSSNIGGQNWNAVAAQLAGATLAGGMWTGTNWNSNLPANGAFLGASAVSFGSAGGGTTGTGPFSVFGTGPSGQGNPLTSGFDMFVVNVPEPTSFALLGLGTAALVIFRRRK
jgi:hypothetical protein